MKNLIVFMSQQGTTEKLAKGIYSQFDSEQTELINLDKQKIRDLSQFDRIIIGGSIHAGKIQSKIQKFCSLNLELLLSKKIGLFICFMDKSRGIEEFETNFPKELREHSSANGLLGGEFIFENMNFLERFAVKKIAKVNESKSEIDYEAIQKFIELLK